MRGGRGPDRAQTETIGVVLLLAMTIIGATVAVAYGSTALRASQQSSQDQAIGNAMAQFDSQAAIAALGEGETQTLQMANGDGQYSVRPDAGWINITHLNYTSGSSETIYNETLGAVVYRNDETDTAIAYQGGGVWRGSGTNVTMVSPPEFHYRSATLTLPVIRVEGDGGGAGAVTATISQSGPVKRVFPNESRTYPATGDAFLNPVENGSVVIKVHSKYYKGWAEYFRTRTTGNVTVYDSNNTAKLKLISTGTFGDFEMPADGNGLPIRGLSGAHSLSNFTITLFEDDDDSADFSNLKWSLYASSGPKQFEVHLRASGSTNCGDRIKTVVYYSGDGGSNYQTWVNDSSYQIVCESAVSQDVNDDGDQADKFITANLTAMRNITYTDNGVKLLEYSTSGSPTFEDPGTFDQHAGSVSWESRDFAENDETTMYNVTNHYMSLLGSNFDLNVRDKAGNTVSEDDSSGTLETSSSGSKFITFLHVTENRIKVEFS